MNDLNTALKQQALRLGFNLVGITRAEPSPTLDAYRRWIAEGMHGRMGYMARPDRIERREDLRVILPGAESLVMVGLDYHGLNIPADILDDPLRGRIAAYAWNQDYHDVMAPRLEQLAEWLHNQGDDSVKHRVYVDTGAILERSHAQQAGMGFTGKNTMLIHPRRGSYFFLGTLLTTHRFDTYDTPHRATMCGSCTRCLNACPTDAFPQPYVLDARRCISYHTIENKGWIDRELRTRFGNWVYGCDVCQDVCPFQRFARPADTPAFLTVDSDQAAPPLADLLALDDARFKARYADSPVGRIKRARLVRNACIAAGNSGAEQFIPLLTGLLSDDSPLVRGHAAWGLMRIMGDEARPTITASLDRESDPDARAELLDLIENPPAPVD